MKKTFLIVLASITLLALVIGIVSFSLNESADFGKLFFAKEVGNYENIKNFPAYSWLLNGKDYTLEIFDNIFYNINYIFENMF